MGHWSIGCRTPLHCGWRSAINVYGARPKLRPFKLVTLHIRELKITKKQIGWSSRTKVMSHLSFHTYAHKYGLARENQDFSSSLCFLHTMAWVLWNCVFSSKLPWSKESFPFYNFFILMNHWPDILHWKRTLEIFILVPNLDKYEKIKISFSNMNYSYKGSNCHEMHKTQNHQYTFRYFVRKNHINWLLHIPMVDSFASEVMKIRSRPYLGLYIWNVQTSIAFVRLDEYITFLVILSYSNIVLTKKSGFVFGRDLQALMAVRYPQCGPTWRTWHFIRADGLLFLVCMYLSPLLILEL